MHEIAREPAPATAQRQPLPTGTVTFLFTDVEGSTRLLARLGDAYPAVLLEHRRILRDAFERWRGVEVDNQGDSFLAAFATSADAVACALDAQVALRQHAWPDGAEVRVRMGVHAGHAELVGDGYVGMDVHRAARVMAAAHGGQTVISESAAALVQGQLAPGAWLVDLGTHRLKDLDRPEHLFQLDHPDLIHEFPRLRSLGGATVLPEQASTFVGRQRELAEISRLLQPGSVRLITLTGPGGTGKTRLALEAAAAEDRSGGAVYFVDLAAVTETEPALALIAQALGLAQAREQPVLEDLKRHLRERRALLVLDNFEQVTSAAPAIAELLAACPSLAVLATSREALHIRGEQLLPVPPLSLPESGPDSQSLEVISQFEAIQLFVERARAVRPDFALTDKNMAAVADICRRLDGLPLAIELATARINLFSPATLRDRLRAGLSVLPQGPRDLPARQQTLRATIDWSYRLLDSAEQRLFGCLSVFAGLDADAVEQLGAVPGLDLEGEPDPLSVLASLLDKSLVRIVESAAGPERFTMLETIRDFAADRLDEDRELAEAARRVHATYYAALALEKLPREARESGASALDALGVEIENLRTCWKFLVGAHDLELLTTLVEPISLVYQAAGRYNDALELTTDLLDVLSAAPPSPERSVQEMTLRASYARALMTTRGYGPEADEAFAKALELFEGHRDDARIFPVLRDLARLHILRGDIASADVIGTELTRLGDSLDDDGIRVDAHLVVANSKMWHGDLAAASAHLDRAIELSEAADYPTRRFRFGPDPRVSSRTTSGFVLWLSGYPDRGLERASRAVALGATLDPYSHAYALYHCAFLHLCRMEPQRVQARARELVDLAANHDFVIWMALGTVLDGMAATLMGSPDSGLRQIEDGLERYRGMRTPPIFWMFLQFLHAAALLVAGRPSDALVVVDGVISDAGDFPAAAQFHLLRGDVRMAQGEPDARASYGRARDMAAGVGARMVELEAELRLYGLDRSAGKDRPEALRRVYDTFTEGFDLVDLVQAKAALDAPSVGSGPGQPPAER